VTHLELSHVSKVFGSIRAVHDLNLTVERGEILSILGPSGCGKTTTLRMIAGLEKPTWGAIISNGRDITSVPARHRNIGMVFQNYALFPHLDVYENVAFGVKTRGVPNHAVKTRVAKALTSVRMEGFEQRQVHQLSGGQQQRIALARALAIEPEVLLLDEPLSNLDPSLREDLREQIRSTIREFSVTTIFVTHDQQEAFALADRIAVMDAGVCHQINKPEEVYHRPADVFVARFLGKANLLPARRVGGALEIADGLKLPWNGSSLSDAQQVFIFIRPENIVIMPSSGTLNEDEFSRSFPATITSAAFEGPLVNYVLDLGGARLVARQFHHGSRRLAPGERVRAVIPEGQFHAIIES
jgi:ABC-type Fe3+/spermidine/putrescine transport system ATPase subunit